MSSLHHPWRAFRSLTDWTLRWARLPDDVWGETCHETKTVTLHVDLTQAERRCTIAHEMEHIWRGEVPHGREAYEEAIVDRRTARVMLPDIREVGEALAFSPNLYDAANELWVDEFVLHERLTSLHPSERAYLRRRLEEMDAIVSHVGHTEQ